MSVAAEAGKIIQIEPDHLYPLTTIASVDPQRLKRTVECLAAGAESGVIRTIVYKENIYMLDGNYEMLAANILQKKAVNIEFVDRNKIPFWCDDENLKNTLCAVGISTLYDFEAIGNFTYEEYPCEYGGQ